MVDDLSTSGKKVFLTYGSPFLNCDYIIIEYFDVIRCPQFTLLSALLETDIFRQIFDTSEIEQLSKNDLYNWYTSRKYKEVFLNLDVRPEVLQSEFGGDEEKAKEWVLNFEKQELSEINVYDAAENKLHFSDAVDFIKNLDVIKKVFIYTEYYIDFVKNDIINTFGGNIEYVYGDFTEFLREKDITSNSTFVFSSLNKMNYLRDTGLLAFSSILISDGYWYNYLDDGTAVVDIDVLSNDTIFKMYYFDGTIPKMTYEDKFANDDENELDDDIE